MSRFLSNYASPLLKYILFKWEKCIKFNFSHSFPKETHPRQPVFSLFKVVLEGYHRYFFGVKVKTVKLIGGRRFLAARSGLMVQITLRLLYMPAQIIQMMAVTRIMAIWTPAITLQDHLKFENTGLHQHDQAQNPKSEVFDIFLTTDNHSVPHFSLPLESVQFQPIRFMGCGDQEDFCFYKIYSKQRYMGL